MGCRSSPGKSLVPRTRSSHSRLPQGCANFGIGTLAVVHKRATAPRTRRCALILRAFVMTLPLDRMPTAIRALAAIVLIAGAAALAACGESQNRQAAPPPPAVTVAKPVQR